MRVGPSGSLPVPPASPKVVIVFLVERACVRRRGRTRVEGVLVDGCLVVVTVFTSNDWGREGCSHDRYDTLK